MQTLLLQSTRDSNPRRRHLFLVARFFFESRVEFSANFYRLVLYLTLHYYIYCCYCLLMGAGNEVLSLSAEINAGALNVLLMGGSLTRCSKFSLEVLPKEVG